MDNVPIVIIRKWWDFQNVNKGLIYFETQLNMSLNYRQFIYPVRFANSYLNVRMRYHATQVTPLCDLR